MNEYGGINMMLSNSNGKMGNKASPRQGAAKGQGAGMGGCNMGSVNKALGQIKGAAKASYSMGAGSQRGKK
jgi:hypothetical protein